MTNSQHTDAEIPPGPIRYKNGIECPSLDEIVTLFESDEHDADMTVSDHVNRCAYCASRLELLLRSFEVDALHGADPKQVTQPAPERVVIPNSGDPVEIAKAKRSSRRAWMATAASWTLLPLLGWHEHDKRQQAESALADANRKLAWRQNPTQTPSAPVGTLVLDVADPNVKITLGNQEFENTGSLRFVSTEVGRGEVRLANESGTFLRRRIWLTADNRERIHFSGHGEQIAASCPIRFVYDEDRVVQLDANELRSIAFTRDDERIVISGDQGHGKGGISIMEMENQETIAWDLQSKDVAALDITADDRLIAWSTFDDRKVKIASLGNLGIDMASVEVVKSERITNTTRMAWLPDSSNEDEDEPGLIVADENGFVGVWRRGQAGISEIAKEPTRFHCVDTSPDGKWIVVAGGEWEAWDADSSYGLVKVIDSKSLETVAEFREHQGTILAIAISPDSTTLATAGVDRTIKLWDLATGKLQRNIDAHDSVIETLAFSPDGRVLASGSWDNTLKLWNGSTGDWYGTISRHTFNLQCVRFSHDGTQLASSGADGTIRFWHCVDNSPVA